MPFDSLWLDSGLIHNEIIPKEGKIMNQSNAVRGYETRLASMYLNAIHSRFRIVNNEYTINE
jgi:hypothetical protein